MRKTVFRCIGKIFSAVRWERLISLLAVFLFVWLGSKKMWADHDSNHITNLKAAFILSALNHVRWQEVDLPASHLNVEMLVVGKDINKITDRLSYVMQTTEFKLKNCSVEVKNILSLKEAEDQMGKNGSKLILLLDSESESWSRDKYPNIPGTLIMGESNNFARKGLVLTLIQENNRLKIGINLKKAESMKLKISSKLLTLNRVVFQEK